MIPRPAAVQPGQRCPRCHLGGDLSLGTPSSWRQGLVQLTSASPRHAQELLWARRDCLLKSSPGKLLLQVELGEEKT